MRRSLGRTGSLPSGIGDCHVYPQQALASSEQFSARVALFHRCCLVTGAISGTSAHERSAGVGSARSTGVASRSGSAAGRTTNRTERLYSHRHGHGAPAPTHRHGKAGCARSGHDPAPTAANTDGNRERNHRRATGGNVAVQSAAGFIEHHHQQPDSSEPGPELRQPVLHAPRRHVGRSRTRRIAPGAARAR